MRKTIYKMAGLLALGSLLIFCGGDKDKKPEPEDAKQSVLIL